MRRSTRRSRLGPSGFSEQLMDQAWFTSMALSVTMDTWAAGCTVRLKGGGVASMQRSTILLFSNSTTWSLKDRTILTSTLVLSQTPLEVTIGTSFAPLLFYANQDHNRYEAQLRRVLAARNMKDYVDLRRETGISKPSIFSGISEQHRFTLPGSFPSDLMHLISLNITDVLLNLLRGNLDRGEHDNAEDWDWAALTGAFWDSSGEVVEKMRRYLPGSFDRPPRNPAKKISSGYKAREYLSYVYGMLPGLLVGVLPDKYHKNFCLLLRGIRLILQRKITKEELILAHESLVTFCLEYEELYVQRNPERVHFVRYCIHNLLHLASETVRIGPLCLLAQWTMERAIGYLTQELRQPSNPYHNLSERGLRRAQVNALNAMVGDLEPEPSPPANSIDFGDGYLLMAPKGAVHTMEDSEHQAFTKFLQSTGHDIPDGAEVTTAPWARLLLPTGQIARTAWKELAKSDDAPLRISRMVKMKLGDEIRFGEIAYFFQAPVRGTNTALAMVSMCEKPIQGFLDESYGMLCITKWETGSNLVVVEAKSIDSVVAFLPFDQMPGYSFLFEDFGLDVAMLSNDSYTVDENTGEIATDVPTDA
ncbi:hypothetical protein DFP72DRAFT_244939 [Ephemerocybe angulata]|uniref:Uncharacterized protein n=1 Tax=Ephemerocybe angulata TaxID=980116 RepID=A0A8H6H8R4_9AGAR|nr:hypothetical protein DFP72DRAFT_244939 [Tulosesus angulatus]